MLNYGHFYYRTIGEGAAVAAILAARSYGFTAIIEAEASDTAGFG